MRIKKCAMCEGIIQEGDWVIIDFNGQLYNSEECLFEFYGEDYLAFQGSGKKLGDVFQLKYVGPYIPTKIERATAREKTVHIDIPYSVRDELDFWYESHDLSIPKNYGLIISTLIHGYKK